MGGGRRPHRHHRHQLSGPPDAPVLVGVVQQDIPISNSAFARLQAFFLLAYALMYAVGGRLVDRLGTRVGYAIAAAAWSAACMLHAAATSFAGLAAARFLLGLGQGGGFPRLGQGGGRVVSSRERSMAVGWFNAGSSLGALVAPPMLAGLAALWGWRSAFVVAGAFGLVWAVVWAWWYAPATASRAVTEEERAYIVGEYPRPRRLLCPGGACCASRRS